MHNEKADNERLLRLAVPFAVSGVGPRRTEWCCWPRGPGRRRQHERHAEAGVTRASSCGSPAGRFGTALVAPTAYAGTGQRCGTDQRRLGAITDLRAKSRGDHHRSPPADAPSMIIPFRIFILVRPKVKLTVWPTTRRRPPQTAAPTTRSPPGLQARRRGRRPGPPRPPGHMKASIDKATAARDGQWHPDRVQPGPDGKAHQRAGRHHPRTLPGHGRAARAHKTGKSAEVLEPELTPPGLARARGAVERRPPVHPPEPFILAAFGLGRFPGIRSRGVNTTLPSESVHQGGYPGARRIA